MKTLLSLATLATVALSTACVIDASDGHRGGRGYGDYGDETTEAPTGNTTASPTPVLVEVDTNAKLEADPGDGVGVFAEYGAGGKWHLFWACDTNQTKRECEYQVRVRPAAGTVTNAVDDAGKAVSTVNGEISLRRTIGTKNDGVRFEAPAGGVITVEVTLDGKAENVLFFFVQDGKLNGGFEGNLTNPIKLQGKTP